MRVNVIGSGYMGKQIASLLSIIGFDILVCQKTSSNLIDEINSEVRKIERVMKFKSKGSLKVVSDLKKLENNITIESVTENLKIKKEIFNELNFNENLFSNTSSIKLSDIGENINGLHFMNPITFKLIEICPKKNFSNEKLSKLTNELKKNYYEIIFVKDTPGYVVNKILFRDISFYFYLIEVEKMKLNDINKIFKSDLKKLDPIKLVNLIGVDTCLEILKNLNKYNSDYYIPKIFQDSIDVNILGNKNKTKFRLL